MCCACRKVGSNHILYMRHVICSLPWYQVCSGFSVAHPGVCCVCRWVGSYDAASNTVTLPPG